ncbi:hypothetical protein AA313_de0210055 [Arthrobotrys entomopaga]|nr:hypothetical protein AA313_de0210055 [Arthrobotrys entomopaga]
MWRLIRIISALGKKKPEKLSTRFSASGCNISGAKYALRWSQFDLIASFYAREGRKKRLSLTNLPACLRTTSSFFNEKKGENFLFFKKMVCELHLGLSTTCIGKFGQFEKKKK